MYSQIKSKDIGGEAKTNKKHSYNSSYVRNVTLQTTQAHVAHETVHFHVQAGNRLAEAQNLWMQGKPSVECELPLASTIQQLFVLVINKFDFFQLHESQPLSLRISGYSRLNLECCKTLISAEF